MRRAYTLLEVIVATSLLAAVLLSAGTLIPRSVLHMRNHSAEAMAAQLADRVIEETRALPGEVIHDGIFDGSQVAAGDYVGRTSVTAFPPAPYPACDIDWQDDGHDVRTHFVFNVRVETLPQLPLGVHHINVKVSWHESAGGRWLPRQWDLDSYLLP